VICNDPEILPPEVVVRVDGLASLSGQYTVTDVNYDGAHGVIVLRARK
jgi:hypothetical protein